MTYTFKDLENATAGTVLAFIDAALRAGADAEVPVACLPVLTRSAVCGSQRSGAGVDCFVFRAFVCTCTTCGFFERLTAAVALLLLSPFFGLIAGLIGVSDGAPVLFRQERYGKNGRPFEIVKFRTMLRRSEGLHEALQRRRGTQGTLFKLERDPRVTRLGALLRRFFLDELPQLINIVKGDMRFVGPRPLPQSDQRCYTQPGHALRLMGLPGMTGLWQVSGRNERTFDEMCLLDVYYLCNRSVLLDLRIVWCTVGLLFKQIGLEREA